MCRFQNKTNAILHTWEGKGGNTKKIECRGTVYNASEEVQTLVHLVAGSSPV